MKRTEAVRLQYQLLTAAKTTDWFQTTDDNAFEKILKQVFSNTSNYEESLDQLILYSETTLNILT